MASKDLAAVVPALTGTNYLIWKQTMKAYLMYSELWVVVSGEWAEPATPVYPTKLKTTPEVMEEMVKQYSEAMAEYRNWKVHDNKALGIITLKISPSMMHLCKNSSSTTWTELEKLYGSPGAA